MANVAADISSKGDQLKSIKKLPPKRELSPLSCIMSKVKLEQVITL